MNKSEKFNEQQRCIAKFAKVISHPARLAILQYLAGTKTCISGDISNKLPLSRTTVSQHLKELREIGLIAGEIDGLKVNYCLCYPVIRKYVGLFDAFFDPVKANDACCGSTDSAPEVCAPDTKPTLH